MDISTLELIALMASGVAIIVGITLATTSRSRPLKAGGYAFTAALFIAVAAAVFLTPAKDADAKYARNIAGLVLLAAAGWAGLSATRAYRGK
jgi:zinc transporter ZupT